MSVGMNSFNYQYQSFTYELLQISLDSINLSNFFILEYSVILLDCMHKKTKLIN